MEEDQTKLDFVIETLVEKIENEIISYREERKKVVWFIINECCFILI